MSHPITEPLAEQISAFLDGELPERELDLLLKRLDRDPELRRTVSRYAAIGESMRSTPRSGISAGFADRVSAAVARESAGAGRGKSSVRRWLPKVGGVLGGVLIAATVAGLAILILQQQATTPGSAQRPLQADATASTVVIGDSIGTGEAPSYTVTLPATTNPIVPAARLTDYVIAHSEYSSPLGRRSMLSGAIAEDPTPVETGEANTPPATPVSQP